LIGDAAVARLLPPHAVLEAIRRAFVDPIVAPPRLATVVDDGDGQSRTLLTMPAMRGGGLATVKVVAVQRGERLRLESHLLAFDMDGRLLAVIEAHALTARRTAAASVLAAQTLGAGQARRLAMLGAGRQARAQVEAFADAMPLTTIAIWARRPEAAEELAVFARERSGDVRIFSSAAEAVRGSDVVSCATGSQAPLVLAADVAEGAHIDLVGGFRPDMREADDALIAGATVVADTPAALTEAGDLAQPIARKLLDADEVLLLSDLLSGEPIRKRGTTTLFKSVGHAAEDLVVAELLIDRLGLGGHLEHGASSSNVDIIERGKRA
jgi:ornithine cyclodeaminase